MFKVVLADLSGFQKDWEQELQANDCPFKLDNWFGTLAACLFCASLLAFTNPAKLA